MILKSSPFSHTIFFSNTMGALASTPTPTLPTVQPTSLFTMESFNTDQLASIKKIQLRFVDRKLGTKYDADCPTIRVLFEINNDTGIVPQDVMDHLRETLFIHMDYECTEEAERKQLRAWTQNFIFMTGKGKRMRNSSHVREAIADAIKADETALPIYIDSTCCNTTVLLTSPRRKSVKTMVAVTTGDAEVTPVNPTTVRADTTAKSVRSRPPLAPKNMNAKASVSSQAKKSLKKVLLNKEAPPFMPSMPTPMDDHVVVMKSSTSSGETVQEGDQFLDKTTSAADAIKKQDGAEDEGFDMNALLEGCMVEDALMLAETEPDDYSPLLVEQGDDVDFLSTMIVSDDDSSKAKASDGEDEPLDMDMESHAYLLPSFFDESTSLMATTSNGGVDMENGSSLFNETERNILQSALDIIGDDITLLAA